MQVLVGFPFLFGVGKKERREREKERGGMPPPLVQFGLGRGKARATS